MVTVKKPSSIIVRGVYILLRKIFFFMYQLKWKSYYLTMSDRFASCGKNNRFDYEVLFIGEKNISIGDNVFIGRNCIINAGKGGHIYIGDGTGIGAYTTIITWNLDNINNKGLKRGENSNIFKNVTIGKGVGIGYGVTINPGITLGDGCEVAAGSVVTRNVNPFEIVAGSPAVVIGRRRESK